MMDGPTSYNNKTNSESALEQKITNRKIYIHQSLSKLGCNLMPVTYTHGCLDIFMQATDSRTELIQWLIAVIYPGYKLDAQYKNIYEDDPRIMVIRRLSCVLWKIGVMPVTKFTKNLDYDKYVEGLIGEESSVNLIYDLCQLAIAKFSPPIDPKLERNLGELLGELIRNNAELVNTSYDPYGVTFPAKYYQEGSTGKQAEYEKSVSLVNEMYDKLVAEFENKSKTKDKEKIESKSNKVKVQYSHEDDEQQNKNQNQNGEQTSFEDIVSEVQGFKQLFGRKYEKLNEAIDKFIHKYDKIVPEDCKEVSALHNGRLLQIPKSLTKSYNVYKQMITNIQPQTFNNEVFSSQSQVCAYLASLNEALL